MLSSASRLRRPAGDNIPVAEFARIQHATEKLNSGEFSYSIFTAAGRLNECNVLVLHLEKDSAMIQPPTQKPKDEYDDQLGQERL